MNQRSSLHQRRQGTEDSPLRLPPLQVRGSGLITNAFTEMRCITPPRSALKFFRIWRPIQLVLGLNPSFAKSVITEEPYTTSPRLQEVRKV
ncbi:hypothetical protein PVK06_035821 [Gossypium arboreum]|uniref:Uncharacterized protein n=1 Tax=Gossypium arboreum TaxID=29729 RepID=A0ABR0NIT0_GOSAR|nr:hypothetical protein PVK06_035821 [Gossypium arboreum]